jgi:hypothetical protein
VLRWDELVVCHLDLFASHLCSWRGREWLIEGRVQHLPVSARFTGRLSMHAGFTGTRVSTDLVQVHWNDGVEYSTVTGASESFLGGIRWSIPQSCAFKATH